ITLANPPDASGAGAVTSSRYINKPLLMRGLVTLGRYENPVGAELAAIEALPDDPGRSEWQAYRSGYYPHTEAIRQLYESMRPFQQNQEVIRQMTESLRPFQQSQEVIRQMTESLRPFQQNQEAIRKLTESMRPLLASQEAIRKLTESMRPFLPIQEAIRRLNEAVEGQ